MASPLQTLHIGYMAIMNSLRKWEYAAYRLQRPIHRVQLLASQDQSRLVTSVLVPPLGVFRQLGWSDKVVLSLLLTMLGFFPGVFHALYLIATDAHC